MQHAAQYCGALLATALIGFAAPQACAQDTRTRATPQTPPPPDGKTSIDLAAWRTSYIDEAGLMPIGATDAAMEYAVGGSFSISSAGTVKGWMRWEEFQPVADPAGPARSTMQLVEVDCQGGRGRMLALDVYPYNNLQGAARHLDVQDPQWTYARPGTVLEQNIGVMCAAARSALSAAVMQASAAPAPDATTPPLASAPTLLASAR